MFRNYPWIRTTTVVALLAAGAAGCVHVEPQVEAAKGQVDHADAYLSGLVGVEKPPKAEMKKPSSSPQVEPPQPLGVEGLADREPAREPETAAGVPETAAGPSESVAGAPASAADQLALAANQGDADAQHALGTAYALSAQTQDDKDKALRWYRAAAQQGHMEAQFRLAEAYLNGNGVERDDREAVAWYRKAAENGHRESQFMLGHLHVLGKGVGRDPQEALRWFAAAAGQGHPLAEGRREIIDNQTSATRTLQ